MSAAKHILVNMRNRDRVIGRALWRISRWEKHRSALVEKYGDKTDELFVVAIGGLKRLKLLQASLSRLDNA